MSHFCQVTEENPKKNIFDGALLVRLNIKLINTVLTDKCNLLIAVPFTTPSPEANPLIFFTSFRIVVKDFFFLMVTGDRVSTTRVRRKKLYFNEGKKV